MPQKPNEGTREGARAAWGHIAQMLETNRNAPYVFEHQKIGYRYRRELDRL